MGWGRPHRTTRTLGKRGYCARQPLADSPDLFLRFASQGYLICRAVNSPACKLLFDMYHTQRNEGHIIRNIDLAWNEIGYFQIGDNPGRKEPGTGEMNYRNILKHIHTKMQADKRDFIFGMDGVDTVPRILLPSSRKRVVVAGVAAADQCRADLRAGRAAFDQATVRGGEQLRAQADREDDQPPELRRRATRHPAPRVLRAPAATPGQSLGPPRRPRPPRHPPHESAPRAVAGRAVASRTPHRSSPRTPPDAPRTWIRAYGCSRPTGPCARTATGSSRRAS